MEDGKKTSDDEHGGVSSIASEDGRLVPFTEGSSATMIWQPRNLSMSQTQVFTEWLKQLEGSPGGVDKLMQEIEQRWAALRSQKEVCDYNCSEDLMSLLKLQQELADLTSALQLAERAAIANGGRLPYLTTDAEAPPVLNRGRQPVSAEEDPREVVNGNSLSDPLLPNEGEENHQHGTSLTNQLSNLVRPAASFIESTSNDTHRMRRIIVGLLFALVFLMAKDLKDAHSRCICHGNGQITRYEEVLQCASQLSNIELKNMDTAHQKAIGYFMVGGGSDVAAECDNEDSLFTVLYSMIMLRERLNIPDHSWHDDKPVTFLSDVCLWARVKCNEEGDAHVTSLILTQAGLSGELPPEVALLRNLKHLQLYTNTGIVGTIPSELGLLTNLEALMIQETSIGGTVPTNLGYLTALEHFFLDGTKLVGSVPEEVCDLTHHGHLTSLHASCSGPSAIITCSCCTSCSPPTLT